MPFAKNDPNINRKGRPPLGLSWAELIRRYGEIYDEELEVPRMLIVVRQLYSEAVKGNIQAIKEIIDRTDGKPRIVAEKSRSEQRSENSLSDDPRVRKTAAELVIGLMKQKGEIDDKFKEYLRDIITKSDCNQETAV